MTIQISIRVPASNIQELRTRWQETLIASRSDMVQEATQAALTEIINNTPIVTGQARAEWESEQARVASSPPSELSAHVSLQTANNSLDHVVYLEYGTRHMAPRSIVRSALAQVESAVPSLFRLSN